MRAGVGAKLKTVVCFQLSRFCPRQILLVVCGGPGRRPLAVIFLIGFIGDQEDGSWKTALGKQRRSDRQKISKAIIKRQHNRVVTQRLPLLVGEQIIRQGNDVVIALKKIKVNSESQAADVQRYRIMRPAARAFRDAVVAEKGYALTVVPGGKSGYAKAIQ